MPYRAVRLTLLCAVFLILAGAASARAQALSRHKDTSGDLYCTYDIDKDSAGLTEGKICIYCRPGTATCVATLTVHPAPEITWQLSGGRGQACASCAQRPERIYELPAGAAGGGGSTSGGGARAYSIFGALLLVWL